MYVHTAAWFVCFFGDLMLLKPKFAKIRKLTEAGKIKERDEAVAVAVEKWAWGNLNRNHVTVNVKGREHIPKDQAVVFVVNHQGLYDIPVMLTSLDKPHGLVAKIEARKIPMLSTWMEYLNCVFMDRNNPREAMKALNDAADKIRAGYSITIFPEGTRSRSDEVGEFKHGAFKMAQKTGAPIVPVCIDGTWKLMEKNGGWMKPGAVNVNILPPIETKGLSREAFKALPEQVRELIIENKGK